MFHVNELDALSQSFSAHFRSLAKEENREAARSSEKQREEKFELKEFHFSFSTATDGSFALNEFFGASDEAECYKLIN